MYIDPFATGATLPSQHPDKRNRTGSMSKLPTPTSAQDAQSEIAWRRYRELITSLRGIQVEVIAAQLMIEAQLEERLELLIPHPEILLPRAGFNQKLNLLCGLHPAPEPFASEFIQHIRRLNKIRNMIAHGKSESMIAAELEALLLQSDSGLDVGNKSEAAFIEALRRLTMLLCGYLTGLTEGETFRALRHLHLNPKGRANDEGTSKLPPA